ncbi:MAG: hypothetical protein WCV84_00705 [Patescibacteria group bacterium]
MWKADATQHIHVDPSISEREVLERATETAHQSAGKTAVCLDVQEAHDVTCSCGAPPSWKTYRVIIHVPDV